MRGEIKSTFEKLDGVRGGMLSRFEQYARWTVPSAFPPDKPDSQSQSELAMSSVEIGARLVVHLAHRIADTMYPNDRSFFSIDLTPKGRRQIAREVAADGGNPEEILGDITRGLTEVENDAMREMNLTEYRPNAIQALILNIITGNALIVRHPTGEDGLQRVVYSARDYVVERNLFGKERHVIYRDQVAFDELSDEHKAAYTAKHAVSKTDDLKITLYTQHKLIDGRWHWSQALDDIDLGIGGAYSLDEWPCILMTWDIARGDDYGRGLVELHAATFHNLDVLSEARLDLIGIAADIKFLVNDASTFDIETYNSAKRGAFVPGNKDSISVTDFHFAVELQHLSDIIAGGERTLAQAFLLQSASVRDAERVTAEEIRFFAREIEAAFGGLYSRLSLSWQKREATYLLTLVEFGDYFTAGGRYSQLMDVSVTSGMETLSREGKLDALTRAIMDMAQLEGVPEDIRVVIDPLKFADYVMRNRNVDATEFLKTAEQVQADAAAQQEAAMAQQQQQQDAQVAMQAMKE